jgi:hypothetical protein
MLVRAHPVEVWLVRRPPLADQRNLSIPAGLAGFARGCQDGGASGLRAGLAEPGADRTGLWQG